MYYACPEVSLLCIAANHPLSMWASSNARQSLIVWYHSKTLNQDTICSTYTIRHTINISITNNFCHISSPIEMIDFPSLEPIIHCTDPCNISWSPILQTFTHCAMCTGHLSWDTYTLCNKLSTKYCSKYPTKRDSSIQLPVIMPVNHTFLVHKHIIVSLCDISLLFILHIIYTQYLSSIHTSITT